MAEPLPLRGRGGGAADSAARAAGAGGGASVTRRPPPAPLLPGSPGAGLPATMPAVGGFPSFQGGLVPPKLGPLNQEECIRWGLASSVW